MLPSFGRALFPASVAAEHLLAALPAERCPMVLAPTSERGWFGGAQLVAVDPHVHETHAPAAGAAAAGTALDAVRDSSEPALCAVLLDYEGGAEVLTYAGGLLAGAGGWRVWGSLDPSTLPDAAPAQERPAPETPLVLGAAADMDRKTFVAGVEATREAIARGDVYVLNLTYRVTGRSTLDPATLFAALLARGASALSAALVTPERAVLSISPERFVAVDGREAWIEPIKGTRPRGADDISDNAFAAELASSTKELAEHVMIVDLERNDLGRVCEPGTVRVDPLYEVVPTPYCHQLVSTVRGTLRADVGCAELILATFPCGSVTGAPKISAMEHIARFETSSRGAYCGALFVAVPGRLDSSVLIRTAEMRGDAVRYGTGGGITYDSDPAAEWEETLLKATPLLGIG